MNVIEAAEKAGIDMSLWNMGSGSLAFVEGVHGIPRSEFERFAQIIRNQALEEAARVCDEKSNAHDIQGKTFILKDLVECAAAIRALKGAKE